MNELFRHTVAKINLEAVRSNYRKIKEISGTNVMPVVKANAYGHGVVKIAKVLEEEGAEIFGVATIEEGIELRKNDVNTPILILGSIYPMENFNAVLDYDLTPIVASNFSAVSLETAAKRKKKKTSFHLKVDSGMGRIGLSVDTAIKLWNELENSEYLEGTGIFTHFARADEDVQYINDQLEKFNNVLEGIRTLPKYIHAANTAAILSCPESCFTLVRPGLGIYGLCPFTNCKEYGLLPVMTWISKIIFLKEIRKGTPVSYGATWIAPRDSKVATICVGYADGYQRVLSNKASVIICGKKCSVVGRVCMDMIIVDVTDVDEVEIGNEVVLLGIDGNEEVSAENMAGWANTINYEITTGISNRVPREYIND